MFTGIVDHFGEIANIESLTEGKQFKIKTLFDDLTVGESIAVNGACLTVVGVEDQYFYCDVSPETLRLTNFILLHVGGQVNLERALRLQDRISGHFVSGHIDQTVELKTKNTIENFVELEFSGIIAECKKYLIHKGSVAVNGVSLTINALTENGFKVMLIPETLAQTNLSALKSSNSVNIEFDLLVKSVVRQLELARNEESKYGL